MGKPKTGVVVDLSNVYLSCEGIYPGRRMDYAKMLTRLREDYDLVRVVAHGAQIDGNAAKFISKMRALGYTTKYKDVRIIGNNARRTNCDVEITLEVVRMVPFVDTLILVSADGDFVELVEYVKEMCKEVVVAGFNISKDLALRANRTIAFDTTYLMDTQHEETK